jgi:thiol-disulfide isomerase/thioredoxin
VILFYNAYWCSTCKAARDGFESGLGEIPEDLTIVLVDFDENTEMRKKYDVIVQHTFVQIDSAGNELQRWYGSTTVAEIEEKIS